MKLLLWGAAAIAAPAMAAMAQAPAQSAEATMADRIYPAACALNAAFHLACAKQTIDLGPVLILDHGQ